MITVGMNYHVLEGRDELFEEKFESVVGALEQAPGHHESRLYRDVADPLSYLIISEWDDKKAFASFIRSDEFRAVTDWGKEKILSGRPNHTVYGG